jgi:hypothetical protein
MTYEMKTGHDGIRYAVFASEWEADEWEEKNDVRLSRYCFDNLFNAIREDDMFPPYWKQSFKVDDHHIEASEGIRYPYVIIKSGEGVVSRHKSLRDAQEALCVIREAQ